MNPKQCRRERNADHCDCLQVGALRAQARKRGPRRSAESRRADLKAHGVRSEVASQPLGRPRHETRKNRRQSDAQQA